MQVARWGNGLAIRIPVAVSRALDLHEGDKVEVVASSGRLEITKAERAALIEEINVLAEPLPSGWIFDRDEANGRGHRFE